MDGVGMDIDQRIERVYSVDLCKGVEKPVLLVRRQCAVIFAKAQRAVLVTVAGDRRFVILFTQSETDVLKGMWHITRWIFRGIVTIDAAIGVARIHWRFIIMLGRVFIVGVIIRRVVRPVSVVLLLMGMRGSSVLGPFFIFFAVFFVCHDCSHLTLATGRI